METQLLVFRKAVRNRFVMPDYLGSDDIFTMVIQGSFSVSWEGKTATVQEAEGFLFRKNVLYHRSVLSPLTMYLFRYRSREPAFACDHVLFGDKNRLFTTLGLLEQLDNGVFKDDYVYRSHLFQDLVFQYAIENGILQGADPVIEQAVARIKDRLSLGVDLAAVAEKTGLSYVQFLRRFKAFTGMTPMDYVTSLRLQQAKELLTGSPLPVKKIANVCGFENEYYFSNFFKKHTGRSPKAFRGEFF